MTQPKELLVGLLRTMLRIRVCEESFVEPILSGTVRCPVHLCTGQEAVAAGFGGVLEPRDYVFGNHRSHGHFLAKGGSMNALVAEIYGKAAGCSRGRGGSMHLIDPSCGMLGSAPIVAGTIPLALGAALASSIRGDGRVTVSFFGDGATGEGVLCEALSFAALKRLPLIFACENNLYSTHLPIREIRVNPEIYRIAKPFGVQAYRVDGNDAVKVHERVRKAAEACRTGDGPVFLEFLTYRQHGHVGPDDNVQGVHTDIRPAEELARWLRRDPIARLERHLVRSRLVSRRELDQLQDAARKEVEDAHRQALASPYPAATELEDHVFAPQKTSL